MLKVWREKERKLNTISGYTQKIELQGPDDGKKLSYFQYNQQKKRNLGLATVFPFFFNEQVNNPI